MTAYDLTLKYISAIGDLQAAMDNKQANNNPMESERLCLEVEKAEAAFFEIKNKLKTITI